MTKSNMDLDPEVATLATAWESARTGRFVRGLIVLCFGLGAMDWVMAAVTLSPALWLCGVAMVLCGLWMLWAWVRIGTRGSSWFVSNLAAAVLTSVVAMSLLVPELVTIMIAGALVPVAIALPFVRTASLRRLMAAVWVTCVALAVASELSARHSDIPAWALSVLRVEGIAAIAAVLLLLLWNYRLRLTESARELSGLVTLSRDLAETLDPEEIGQRMARHLAEATRASTCLISSWDRSADVVATYASYPREKLPSFDRSYPLAGFPMTRHVLEAKAPISLHADDPDADPFEVAILRKESQTALAMLPLVAKGETIGLIELTRNGERFEERDLTLAYSLATEAAMALENARLYQQLRHQAFHDSLTALPNRGLFTDRLEHALARSLRRGLRVAVLFIDVDDFKTVNDRLGHSKGDLTLAAIADRLRACIRSGDTAARLGGDEFAVLLEDIDGRPEAEIMARRILAQLSLPIRLADDGGHGERQHRRRRLRRHHRDGRQPAPQRRPGHVPRQGPR